MKSKELFGLALRLVGLIFLFRGLLALPNIVPMLFSGIRSETILGILFMIGWPLLLAYWFLRGAPQIMNLAYPYPETEPSPKDSATTAPTV